MTKTELLKFMKHIEALEARSDLLARVAGVLRSLDRDQPEWGLRTLAEECEQAAGIHE